MTDNSVTSADGGPVSTSGLATWPADDLPELLLRAATRVATLPQFAHHLSKAAVERWFAFEVAYQLDDLLQAKEWTCLVECGGTRKGEKTLGNFDLLVVPRERTEHGSRLAPSTKPWPDRAWAIEIKGAHLGDGPGGYEKTSLSDLTVKPDLAAEVGYGCGRWLGLLITTSGLWSDLPNRKATEKRAQELRTCSLPLASGLRRVGGRVEMAVEYREWKGYVWVEVLKAAQGAGS